MHEYIIETLLTDKDREMEKGEKQNYYKVISVFHKCYIFYDLINDILVGDS